MIFNISGSHLIIVPSKLKFIIENIRQSLIFEVENKGKYFLFNHVFYFKNLQVIV